MVVWIVVFVVFFFGMVVGFVVLVVRGFWCLLKWFVCVVLDGF